MLKAVVSNDKGDFFCFLKGNVLEICRERVFDRFLSLSFAKGRHSQMLRGTF